MAILRHIRTYLIITKSGQGNQLVLALTRGMANLVIKEVPIIIDKTGEMLPWIN